MPKTILTPRQRAALAAVPAPAAPTPQPSLPSVPFSITELPPILSRSRLAELLDTTAEAIAAAHAENRAWVPPCYRLANRRVPYYKTAEVLALLQPWEVAA